MSKRNQGFTVLELLIVIVVIAIVAAIAIPGLISSQRSSYERNASTSLKTISVAEADFRTNDREGNKINDFWTADLKGLYTITSLTVVGNAGGTVDPPLKLLDLSMACADTDSSTPSAGGENTSISGLGVISPKAGFWYAALTQDTSVTGTSEATYKQDTGGDLPMGSVHNMTKYGFLAFPDSQAYGKFVYIINEGNMVFRAATTGQVRLTQTTPPGAAGFPAVYQNWPDDANMKSFWSKLD